MQFERIRKNHKRKIIIGGLILVCIISAITITTTRAKYELTQNLKLAEGNVNYKTPDLNMVAFYQGEGNSDTDYTAVETVPTSGYLLNNTRSYCAVGETKDATIGIAYSGGKVTISNLVRKGTKCYLYFDKKDTASETILAGITVKTGTPTFSSIATTDEGVYKVSDPVYEGYSYYWRGAVTNNYVKFAGKCWRIVRINGDGSMRLIYDGTTCHANGTSTADSIAVASTAYNTSYNQSNYVGWTYTGTSQRTLSGTSSNAKAQLESWYNSNIGNNTTYASKVADGKYCNDRNVQSGSTWAINGSTFYYAALTRINSNAPTLACNSGDVYTLKVGLITADEVEFAGGKSENNTSYYLYNGQHYWTMSPYRWWIGSTSYAYVFLVNSYGYLGGTYVDSTCGLRPVINLKADTQFQAGGTGTQSNPYVVV